MDRGKWAILVVELGYAVERLKEARALAGEIYLFESLGYRPNSGIALGQIAMLTKEATNHLQGLADVIDSQDAKKEG